MPCSFPASRRAKYLNMKHISQTIIAIPNGDSICGYFGRLGKWQQGVSRTVELYPHNDYHGTRWSVDAQGKDGRQQRLTFTWRLRCTSNSFLDMTCFLTRTEIYYSQKRTTWESPGIELTSSISTSSPRGSGKSGVSSLPTGKQPRTGT